MEKLLPTAVLTALSFLVSGLGIAQETTKSGTNGFGAKLELDASAMGGASVDLEHSDDYTSRPIGKKQKWQLDTGYFDFDDRSSGLLPPGDTTNDYSGIRLRRPRGN